MYDLPGWIVTIPGFPARAWQDRRFPDYLQHDKEPKRQKQNGQMRYSLCPWTEMPDEKVGVAVAQQEQHLEEEHASRPDCRRSAEPGQNKLPDQRLNFEKQKGRAENSQRIVQHSLILTELSNLRDTPKCVSHGRDFQWEPGVAATFCRSLTNPKRRDRFRLVSTIRASDPG